MHFFRFDNQIYIWNEHAQACLIIVDGIEKRKSNDEIGTRRTLSDWKITFDRIQFDFDSKSVCVCVQFITTKYIRIA